MFQSLQQLKRKIFHIDSENFEELALSIFKVQAKQNPVYSRYLDYLGVKPQQITSIRQIPFIPIRLFKKHQVITGAESYEIYFESSGTASAGRSKHYLVDRDLYDQSLLKTFRAFYGPPEQYAILALLPSYLERQRASLIYMVQKLMDQSGNPDNGFFLDDHKTLQKRLLAPGLKDQQVLLIGVSFALLDFAKSYTGPDLDNTLIMETGGMKGRKKEMVREELHEYLKKGFGVSNIHSEYGMTELLSQAYSRSDGRFSTPPWMKVFIGDPRDPFEWQPNGQHGVIKIADLANLYSCSFIATEDIGKKYSDNSFEVLGRLDRSEIRGCNLMAGLS